MTSADQAQALANAQGRPWWLITDRSGGQRLSFDLADAAGYSQLQRFNPAGSFRFHLIQQPTALTK
jgi:hypothetical protein